MAAHSPSLWAMISTVTSKPKRGSASEHANRRTGRFWQRPLLLTVPSGRKTPIFSDVVSPPGLPAVSTFFSRSRFYFVLVSQIVWARRFKARVVYTVAGSEQIDESPDSRIPRSIVAPLPPILTGQRYA